MSIVCIKVPNSISQILDGIKVPGNKTPINEKHITILSLHKNLTLEEISKATIAIAKLVQEVKCFHVTLKGYSCFPKNDTGVPIICHVDSEELHHLHEKVVSTFKQIEISYDTRYPIYRPHVSLSMNNCEIQEKVFKLPITWQVDEISLWCGDQGDDRIYTVFDLLKTHS